jgi:hypothetical protein
VHRVLREMPVPLQQKATPVSVASAL